MRSASPREDAAPTPADLGARGDVFVDGLAGRRAARRFFQGLALGGAAVVLYEVSP
jgi:hypothetical protein